MRGISLAGINFILKCLTIIVWTSMKDGKIYKIIQIEFSQNMVSSKYNLCAQNYQYMNYINMKCQKILTL